jgi:hypothetical protein
MKQIVEQGVLITSVITAIGLYYQNPNDTIRTERRGWLWICVFFAFFLTIVLFFLGLDRGSDTISAQYHLTSQCLSGVAVVGFLVVAYLYGSRGSRPSYHLVLCVAVPTAAIFSFIEFCLSDQSDSYNRIDAPLIGYFVSLALYLIAKITAYVIFIGSGLARGRRGIRLCYVLSSFITVCTIVVGVRLVLGLPSESLIFVFNCIFVALLVIDMVMPKRAQPQTMTAALIACMTYIALSAFIAFMSV